VAGGWELFAPASWKAEICNVVWKAVTLERLAAVDADEVLVAAAALPIESIDVCELWHGALGRAVARRHPAYDVLFVELADRLGTVVASYDARLRSRFPELVRTPADVLRAR
jgi:predicted nucleic acid-binding protein